MSFHMLSGDTSGEPKKNISNTKGANLSETLENPPLLGAK